MVVGGCDVKFDTAVLPNPNENSSRGDTSYVEVTPPYGGFETPVSVLVGNDQLIYVADYDRNKIFMMDAAGVILDSQTVPHPVAIAQNLKLDLYVCGETMAQNGRDTIGAIYKIYLVRFDTTIGGRDTSIMINHDLKNAPMRIIRKEAERPKRRFVGIGIMPDNEFLAARTGPDNTSVVDPDTRVISFDKKDKMITPLGALATRTCGGTAITDISQLTGFAMFPSSRNFIVLQNSLCAAYAAIWMTYRTSAEFSGWEPRFDPSKPEQRSIDFIRTFRFRVPTAATMDRRRSDVFIVDSELDSVLKFDRNGRFKAESFGKYRTASSLLPGLKNPRGIAYSNDCTIYIADTGNKIIRRFKLSLQTTCF